MQMECMCHKNTVIIKLGKDPATKDRVDTVKETELSVKKSTKILNKVLLEEFVHPLVILLNIEKYNITGSKARYKYIHRLFTFNAKLGGSQICYCL